MRNLTWNSHAVDSEEKVFKDVSVTVEQYLYKLSKFSGKKMVF